MKRVFTMRFPIVAAALLTVALSYSGSAQFMRMSPDERAKALKDSLSLDSTQTAKVVAIYTESQAQMRDAFQSGGGDRESMRKTMTTINEKTDSKIEALVSKDQLAKYQILKKSRRPMGGAPGMGRPRGN